MADPVNPFLAFFVPPNDFASAESVAVTIEDDRVWIDVDGENSFRAYRIKTLQVTDRRTKSQETT